MDKKPKVAVKGGAKVTAEGGAKGSGAKGKGGNNSGKDAGKGKKGGTGGQHNQQAAAAGKAASKTNVDGDDRFKRVHHDPRFQRMPKSEQKVESPELAVDDTSRFAYRSR